MEEMEGGGIDDRAAADDTGDIVWGVWEEFVGGGLAGSGGGRGGGAAEMVAFGSGMMGGWCVGGWCCGCCCLSCW